MFFLSGLRKGCLELQGAWQWLHGQEGKKSERDEIAAKLRKNYWQLDPYIRARAFYDRTGMIKPGGSIEYYPSQEVNGAAASSADDVD